MDNIFFYTSFFLYSVSMILSIGYLVTKRETLSSVARTAMMAGIVLQFLSLAFHCSVMQKILPGVECSVWPKRFSSLSFFGLLIAMEYVVVQGFEHLPILGAFVTPFVVGFMTAASLVPPGTVSQILLPPELESSWLLVHVPLIFVAYGAFAIAFAVGLAYLIQEHQLKSKKPSHLAFRLPPLEELDNLIFRIILLAWPVLTVGLVLGNLWAEKAWGQYLRWEDPKQIWSLITLAVYAGYLFLRIVSGWRGRRITYLSLAGFLMVLVTYMGVNHFTKV